MTSTEESKLTVELLFEESFKPDPATNFKFAPDDSCITFLAKNATNPNELSIWRFDLTKHTTQEWLCAPVKLAPRQNPSSKRMNARGNANLPLGSTTIIGSLTAARS